MNTTRRGAVTRLLILSTLPAALLAGPAAAQTLDHIRESGVLTVGVPATAMPWGSVDENGELVGYEIDVAKAMAEDLGVELELVPVTNQNRIAQLLSGRIDLIMAVLGMFPERTEVLQFSQPYAGLSYWVIGPKDAEITEFGDLEGYTISAARGTAEELQITEANIPNTEILRFDDPQASILALLSGQAEAIVGNSTYVGTLHRLGNDQFENKIEMGGQFQGIGMRKGEPDMLEYVNGFIDRIRSDGTLEEINQEWLLQPMPEFPESIEGIIWTLG